jgi:hypothetical protein
MTKVLKTNCLKSSLRPGPSTPRITITTHVRAAASAGEFGGEKVVTRVQRRRVRRAGDRAKRLEELGVRSHKRRGGGSRLATALKRWVACLSIAQNIGP